MRPNEKFPGSDHARHVCRDCSKLGSSELQYRQERRNLEILVCGGDIIGRKKRKAFNRFLQHPDPRIRRYAEALAIRDIEARAQRFLEYGDDLEPEDDPVEFEGAAVSTHPGVETAGLFCGRTLVRTYYSDGVSIYHKSKIILIPSQTRFLNPYSFSFAKSVGNLVER